MVELFKCTKFTSYNATWVQACGWWVEVFDKPQINVYTMYRIVLITNHLSPTTHPPTHGGNILSIGGRHL